MAQEYTTPDGSQLYIPAAYTSYTVINGAGGLATTGILAIIGESSQGIDFTQEEDLNSNVFGPSSFSDVLAKYGSGPIVDAVRAAITPANDPNITGSPSGFLIVKTNPSTQASSILTKVTSGTYATLFSVQTGVLQNMIYFTITQATPEVVPSTTPFTYIPPVSALNADLRVNGNAAEALAVTANMTPAAFQAAVNALAGIDASGGALESTLPVADNLALLAGGFTVTITYTGTFITTPLAGDTLVIPVGSVLAGIANDNVGAYVITAAASTEISAVKLSDAGKPGAVTGTVTSPISVGSTPVVASTDLEVYGPITINLTAASIIDGEGKTLEINELTTGTDLLSRTAYQLGTTAVVTWVSKSGTPTVLTSTSEYSVSLNVNRQSDNVNQVLTAGGPVVLKVGYTGTDCVVVVTPTTMTLTVTGGVGTTQTLNLKNFGSISELANYLNAQPGFNAAPGTTALGQQSPLTLDEGTFHASSTWGDPTLRLKMDAVSFFQVVSGSGIVQINNPAATAPAGLPALQATTYLTGGTLAPTTDAIFDAALLALQSCKCNFVVPLFSRDASADIIDGVTDPGSTYTIANINAATRTHVLAMSTLKRRKNRQAFLSMRDTYVNDKEMAATLASARCSLAFQDMKVVGSNGIIQAQPWMSAVVAAGMQAAAFYKAIFHKGINCSGTIQAAGDFKSNNDDQLEDALKSGLLVSHVPDQGGVQFVSDQTTYLTDNNFVFNSIQAMYAADTVSLSTAQRMEQAFVGQSLADVNAALALSAFEMIMDDMLRLKLIAISDDAPKGFKNVSIKIAGPTMLVNAEIKLATALYFCVITFLVSQVTSAASQ